MVAVMGILVFAGALVVAVGIMAATIAPQWRRIVRLASGHVEQSFSPLAQLASAERRIAVRRWASTSAPMAARRPRAAA